MNSFMITGVTTVVLVAAGIGAHQYLLHRAASQAAEMERAKIAAQANQNIAERRERDAEFDRTDAMQLCRAAGLEWFADAGRSYCRVKPA